MKTSVKLWPSLNTIFREEGYKVSIIVDTLEFPVTFVLLVLSIQRKVIWSLCKLRKRMLWNFYNKSSVNLRKRLQYRFSFNRPTNVKERSNNEKSQETGNGILVSVSFTTQNNYIELRSLVVLSSGYKWH